LTTQEEGGRFPALGLYVSFALYYNHSRFSNFNDVVTTRSPSTTPDQTTQLFIP
jgi:hypothetical protein